MKKQTAGRDRLGELAPKFAELNDDVLFGEVWSREEELSARDRSMATIAALREKYDLHMTVERYVSAETPETENRFIRE